MADSKVSALTEATPALADVVYLLDDPGGTPSDKKATVQGILEAGLGQEHFYVPAVSMLSRTTSGAEAATTELTVTHDVMLETMNFDAAADEFVQFSLQMPKAWDGGTVVCQFIWSHPATTTNFGVTWAIEARAYADDELGENAWGTEATAADTGGTTDDIYFSPETTMTVAGSPAGEELVVFQVYRDVSGPGASNLDVDARLHGVKIHWTKGALNND